MIPAGYCERRPSARLANYVECYWSRVDQGDGAHSVLPDGCADILFTRKNHGAAQLSLVGLMTRPLPVAAERGRVYFGIRFRPGMAAAFVPESALLNDRSEPLESLWGGFARALMERLAEADDVASLMGVAEQVLRPMEPPDLACRVLWRMAGGTARPLEELVTAAGLSERHFRRQCLARTGVAPKYLERILRFRRAMERIRLLAAQPGWAQLAAGCGYYDQAHLIREFQEFAGCTPGRFLQSLRGAGGLESKHDEPTETRKSNRLY